MLEVALGKYVEAAIIAVLLVFNAALGFFQRGRAQATLAALKSRLALNASVKRDGTWGTVPAAGLVPGDVVKLSLGAVVAADVRLTEGSVLLDQSMLTGKSVPIEAGAGFETYAGALVRRGEAVAEVTATGARTKFGRTAELVRTGHRDRDRVLFRVFPRWEFAIGTGKNGGHKDSTDRVEGASRKLSRWRFEHLQFVNRSICSVDSVREKTLLLRGS